MALLALSEIASGERGVLTPWFGLTFNRRRRICEELCQPPGRCSSIQPESDHAEQPGEQDNGGNDEDDLGAVLENQ
jgi:hypothetical protein